MARVLRNVSALLHLYYRSLTDFLPPPLLLLPPTNALSPYSRAYYEYTMFKQILYIYDYIYKAEARILLSDNRLRCRTL